MALLLLNYDTCLWSICCYYCCWVKMILPGDFDLSILYNCLIVYGLNLNFSLNIHS